MTDPTQTLRERFADALAGAFGDQAADADPMIRPSANPKFGDYQSNAAMPLAKRLGRPPRDVTAALVDHLDVADVCEPPEIAGPGFINLRLREDYLARQARALADDDRLGVTPVEQPQTVVVDYAGPNAAKEMHVGHIRSTVIGDALARTLASVGHRVIRQNHIGDWGTQFGMLCEYLVEQGGAGDRSIGDLDDFYRRAKQRFDADPDFADRARRRVVALQSGDEATLAIWRTLIDVSKHHMDALFDRLNITLRPDDVRPESFYNDMLGPTADELEQAGVARVSDGALCVFVPKYEAPAMLRKSDGGFGYDATDVAAIRFRIRDLGVDRIIYVTDARQAEHFAKVFWAARQAGWAAGVALEHAPFGQILGEDNKPFKTRSGDTVKLADLLDEAEQRAADIVRQKNPDLTADERQRVAHIVGIGAVKYADLSGDRTKDYQFSWSRMLAMDGNTAPYLQYAYARIQSIFRRVAASPTGAQGGAAADVILTHDAERALVLRMLQFAPTVHSVGENLEPHHLCNCLYDLATAFSAFYEACPVLNAGDTQTMHSRLVLCDLAARTLRAGLGLLGIEVMERM